jgi:predicted transcriptional regulator
MKQKTVSFQPNPDLLKILKEQAAAQDRSVSWLINHYIKKGMEAEKLIKSQEKKTDQP